MSGSSRVSRSQARIKLARAGLSCPSEREEKVYKDGKLKNQEPVDRKEQPEADEASGVPGA